MAKLVFLCVFILICLKSATALPSKKLSTATSTTTTEKPAMQDIEEALETLKENFSNLVMKVQDHPVVKDVSERIEQFAIDVTNMSKQIVHKL